MIPISQALKATPNNGQNGLERIELTKQENNFLDALGGPKLLHCADDVISGILAFGLFKLGLKFEKADKVLLDAAIEELKRLYGGLTVKELKLAFDMASRLELDFNPETYQNFSILYLNKLMTAYLNWSTEAYNTLRPNSNREDETESNHFDTYTHRIMSDNQIRGEIQTGYMHFLSGVLSQSAYIPYEWYRVLIVDGFIEHDPEAGIKHRVKFRDLTEDMKRRLKRSQEYVWQLFEAAQARNMSALYQLEK